MQNAVYVVSGKAYPQQMYFQQVSQQIPQLQVPQSPTGEEASTRDIVADSRRLVTTNSPPCSHNRWSLQIRKKRYYVFECMNCETLWKTKLTGTQKCLDFFAGHCPNGDGCKYPHIYSKRALNFNKEESSLEMFRSSGVTLGGCSPQSNPTDVSDLTSILTKVQQLAEEEDFLNESTSESCSLSCNSSCYVSCSEK